MSVGKEEEGETEVMCIATSECLNQVLGCLFMLFFSQLEIYQTGEEWQQNPWGQNERLSQFETEMMMGKHRVVAETLETYGDLYFEVIWWWE